MKGFLVGLLLVVSAVGMMGCTRVGTGELGIVLDVNKEVKAMPVMNSWELHILDTLHVVDATQVRLMVTDVKAKDIDGILFQDIDAQITYNLNSKGVIDFYRKTREIDLDSDNNKVLGFRVVSKEARNALVKTIVQFKANQVNTDKATLEAKLKEILTAELEARFPDTFEITDVNIDSAQLDQNVEKVLQAQALLDSEKRTMESRLELQKKQQEVLEQELIGLRIMAAKAGISVETLLKYRTETERNKALAEMARNSGANVQVQVKE